MTANSLRLVRSGIQDRKLQVIIRDKPTQMTIYLSGDLTSETALDFTKSLPFIITKPIFIDFNDLTIIDGSGLMAFAVFFVHVLDAGHRAVVIRLNGQPLEIFRFFDIYDICCKQRRRTDIQNHRWIPILKRLMDIGISLVALTTFLIPGLIIAALIRLESRGPVLYTQRRLKRHDRKDHHDLSHPDENDTFMMYKFRTMREDAESESGAVNASENDPRVTRVGRFLRKTRLDEIPNFLNVLFGEMSVVGPRADRLEILHSVTDDFPVVFERSRFVKPGITGFAQIVLRSNGTLPHSDHELIKIVPDHDRHSEVKSFRYKIYYEAAYILKSRQLKSWFRSELWTLLNTPITMFFRQNTIS